MIPADGPVSVNYDTHISEEFGFIFFNNPKAGCSTTKATLNLACAARLGIALHYKTIRDIHDRAANVLKTPKQIGFKRFRQMVSDPKIVRFCVLREPISRFASAYASKVSRDSPQRQRLNAAMDRPIDQAWPDINEFAAALAFAPAVRDCDGHWRSQFRQVHGAHIDLTLVGFHEELDASLRKFARIIFGDDAIEIFDARQHFSENRSDSQTGMQALTPNSLSLLRRAYAEDFAFCRREWARMHGDADLPVHPTNGG